MAPTTTTTATTTTCASGFVYGRPYSRTTIKKLRLRSDAKEWFWTCTGCSVTSEAFSSKFDAETALDCTAHAPRKPDRPIGSNAANPWLVKSHGHVHAQAPFIPLNHRARRRIGATAPPAK